MFSALTPYNGKIFEYQILPLQGAMVIIFAFPGCYPGLRDKSLSALGYSIINS